MRNDDELGLSFCRIKVEPKAVRDSLKGGEQSLGIGMGVREENNVIRICECRDAKGIDTFGLISVRAPRAGSTWRRT